MKIFTTFLLTISSLLSAPLIKLTPTFENQKIKLPVALATPADLSDCPLIPHQFEEGPPGDLKFIKPIHEYGISITGGIHHRGQAVPASEGKYLSADWRFSSIWALDHPNGQATNPQVFTHTESKVSCKPTALVEEASGELLVLSQDGKIDTIAPSR